MKQVAGRIKADLAQFRELAAFAQFGSDLDAKTQAQLERGKRIVEVFKQPQYNPMPVEIQAAVLWTVQNGLMDDVAGGKNQRFPSQAHRLSYQPQSRLDGENRKEKALSDALTADLKAADHRIQTNLHNRTISISNAQHTRHTPTHQVGQKHGANHQGHADGRCLENAQGATGGAGGTPLRRLMNEVLAQVTGNARRFHPSVDGSARSEKTRGHRHQQRQRFVRRA